MLIDVIHDDDVFEGVINLVVVESEHVHPPPSFDVLSGFVFRVDDVPVLSSYMDKSIFLVFICLL